MTSNTKKKGSSKQPEMSASLLSNLAWVSVLFYFFLECLRVSIEIRLIAIQRFGKVIHEFDPYFNFWATEYLYNHGAKKFFTWFDYKVWYPLGRPIGTTIYPGMQFTAVWIKEYILGDSMSLNDICVYIPVWFGCLASMLVGLITYECSLDCNTNFTVIDLVISLVSGKEIKDIQKTPPKKIESFFGLTSPAVESGLLAMAMMAIVPAHLTRSVGGGFDNESVAVSAMLLTFYFWVRSLRSGERFNYLFSILSGISYFYMVATWGGYVFALNMIGLHAAFLVLIGRFSTNVYLSYSIFYVIGTYLATTVPVVGMAPLKSLEQLGPCFVFFVYQLLQFCAVASRKKTMTRGQAMMLRIQVITIGILILALTVVFFAPRGYFGPISARVRGLFVKHTKTGNPLVDSVAEHQPANNSAYFQYLQHLCLFGPIGFFLLFKYFGDVPSFVLVYSLTAYYFSNKMVRLILLMGPVTSILGGIAVGRIVSWSTKLLWSSDDESNDTVTDTIEELSNTKPAKIKKVVSKSKFDTMKKKGNAKASAKSENDSNIPFLTKKESLLLKRVIAVCILWALYLFANSFVDYCWRLSYGISQATIIQTARNRHDDSLVLIDDYRQAYWWLRDNTPEDSRVLAWWDYGYQITAIANRTTIADGNTWNHEHIALLGKVLTTNFEEGYSIARHLADYVLIWAGGGGDDLAKSPHLARIANSVYRDMCPGDPTCRGFGFLDQARTPSSMMRASFLYKLHSHNIVPGVTVDPTKFKEVYTSKYGKVRIFQLIGVDQESRAWVADPKNRVCDVEGGWFCRGQYPPALREVLAKKVDFAQLEDFNVKKSDSEYQKQYFENLNNAKKLQSDILVSEKQKLLQERLDQLQQQENEDVSVEKPSQEAINALYNKWEDTDYTTLMWRVISQGKSEELESMLDTNPIMAFMRSSDGRGPMWWAFENRKQEIVKILMRHGVPHTDKDKYGKTPVDLLDSSL